MADKKVFVLTTQTENIKGFIALTAGIKLDRFRKNPVMLDMHDQTKLLGKWTDLSVVGTDIKASPLFNSKNPNAAQREQEVNDGFLKGASVGLIPLKWAMSEDLGMPAGQLVLVESILTEASLCPIPANEDAIVLYNDSGQRLSDNYLAEIKLSFSNNKTTGMDFKPIIVAALNLSATASDAEVTAALQAAASKLKSLEQENVQLKAADASRVEAEITATVNQYKEAGVISEELVPTFVGLCQKDFDGTKKALAALKPAVATPVNLMQQMHQQAAGGAKPNAANDRSQWKLSDWMDKDVSGLEKLKATDKDTYVKLFADAGIAVEA